MTKLLLIISLLTLLGSAGIGIMNRQTFVNLRSEKDSLNAKVQETIDGIGTERIKEINVTFTDLDTTERKLAEDEATLELTNSNLVTARREIESEKAKEAPLDEKLQQFATLLSDLQTKFPGMKASDIAKKIEELERRKKDLGTEEEALLAEVEVLSKKVDSNLAEVTRREEKQRARSVGIARNVMEATITAVNQDWGFVVFNSGENMGLTMDSKLYVKRGAQILGRLKPISVDPRMTVANIDARSLREGVVVMPGDTVILGTVSE